jgi:uridine kinase
MNNGPDTPVWIKVRLPGQPTREVPMGTRVGDLEGVREPIHGLEILAALVNNDVVTLAYPLEVDCEVTPLTLCHPYGWRVYRNSAAFLLARVVHELYPHMHFAVEHSLGTGYYCSFSDPREKTSGASEEQLRHIEARMREWVGWDVPIVHRRIAYADALHRFEETGREDQANLLRYRNPPKISVYRCGEYLDLAHHILADRTGVLGHFALHPYEHGFILQFPDRERAPEIAPFDPQPHLFQIFREHKEWGRILGLRTAGDLNRLIAEGGAPDMVRIAEGLHEKKIARLADILADRREHVRFIFIAGPSSSGKTTFTKRLAVQLRVAGLRPRMISVDDYFVDRSRTPPDEHGQPDYEHIETVDLDLLNCHFIELAEGREIEQPSYNFETGERVYRGRQMKLEEDEVLIVEGIHCLNPRLTASVPADWKFRIYISALTQLNLDGHNRVATTDNRLIRRMVRDHQFRGNDAARTLEMWPSVRRGEKTWIYPFQREADVAFNSALDYELAVLKPFAEPLLQSIKPWQASYADARRLLAFLDLFLTQSPGVVPPNSILREFIGRSAFRYG